MTYECAWCNQPLPNYTSTGSERVSHGICLPCVKIHFPAEYPAVMARWAEAYEAAAADPDIDTATLRMMRRGAFTGLAV